MGVTGVETIRDAVVIGDPIVDGHQLGFGRQIEDVSRLDQILCTDEDLESDSRPRKVRPHASARIGLDDGVDAGRVERADRHVRFRSAAECMHDDEFAVGHGCILAT